MGRWELFVLAVGLAMDAMAAAVCLGLSVRRLRVGHALVTGLYFGGAQALMPLCGYLLGHYFRDLILRVDHWIAFFLLTFIGLHMIRESFSTERAVEIPPSAVPCTAASPLSPRAMIPLAIATSIDALAVGVTLAFLQVKILPAATVIGLVTFLLSAAGIWVGHLCGTRCRRIAERIGGGVLIALGVRILIEHLRG